MPAVAHIAVNLTSFIEQLDTVCDIERIIGANSRTPELVLGDIRGQLGADRLGERRLNELASTCFPRNT